MYTGTCDKVYTVFLYTCDKVYKGIKMSDFNKQKYDNEYARNNYDRCIFNVPKGQKAIIEQHWKRKGYKSLNTYINELIKRDMTEAPKNRNDNYFT